MAMKSGTDARSRIGLLGAAAMTLMLSAAATRPALALEDDGRESIFSSLVSMVMPGDTNPESRIDYRERAPLVVPKNREALPAPQPKAAERTKAWPKNRTINLVFHGHSVPTGYQKTPEVRTFESYPQLGEIKKRFE